MTQYVYAGAGRWTSASDDGHPGGLMRAEVGSGAWQPLSNGLPPKAGESACIKQTTLKR